MKIEKRKVTESTKLSSIAKSAAASTLGMAALFSLSACVESDPVSAYESPKISSSGTSDSMNSTDSNNSPESSSSSTTIESSSSKQAPPSRSPFSSSSMLSGIAMTSSSRIYIPPTHTPLSSSATEAVKSISSSSTATQRPTIKITVEEPKSSSSTKVERQEIIIKERKDTILVPNVHLCEDPSCPGVLIDSMVTTFEINDIQA